jgi:hypothetical protein
MLTIFIERTDNSKTKDNYAWTLTHIAQSHTPTISCKNTERVTKWVALNWLWFKQQAAHTKHHKTTEKYQCPLWRKYDLGQNKIL